MKFRSILFYLLLYPIYSFAQLPDSLLALPNDTLETIVSDTTIIYVIQEEPVTIIEKVKVVKAKAHYSLSLSASILAYHEFKKARSSFEEYLSKVNEVTKNLPSYSFNIAIWKCPKKIYTEYSLSFLRLLQEFNYTYTDPYVLNGHIYPADLEPSQTTVNNFNYVYAGVVLGYCINRNKTVSYIPSGGVLVANLLSYSSNTLSKTDPSHPASIREEIRYREFIGDLSLQIRCLINLKNNLFEITPYCRFAPISSTDKNAPYSIHRTLLGLKIGLNNKLF